jgi:DNA-binding MarR family transcriptional regulator
VDFRRSDGVTQNQLVVLMAVRSARTGRRLRMSELARLLRVSTPTATGVVARLEKAGLLRREKGERDRREVCVAPTAKGEGAVRRFQGVVRRRWAEVLSPLGQGELTSMHRALSKAAARLMKEVAG